MGIEIIAEGKISVGNGETLQEDGGGASIGEGGGLCSTPGLKSTLGCVFVR